jgi:hypothetical protein
MTFFSSFHNRQWLQRRHCTLKVNVANWDGVLIPDGTPGVILSDPAVAVGVNEKVPLPAPPLIDAEAGMVPTAELECVSGTVSADPPANGWREAPDARTTVLTVTV